MPRKARQNIIAPHQLYHIVSRGNNERRIFRAPRDYKKFLSILKETKEMHPFYFYCYSLMPNHYHLEIETILENISKIMHRVNFLYAIYFKKRHKTTGHLYQDRFYSSLIDKESYFWAVARYIDLNPVKANLAKEPEDWKWGSFRCYYQKSFKDGLIDWERFLEFGDEDLEVSRRNYIEFVKEGKKVEQVSSFLVKRML